MPETMTVAPTLNDVVGFTLYLVVAETGVAAVIGIEGLTLVPTFPFKDKV
jgi:hypothetical protein